MTAVLAGRLCWAGDYNLAKRYTGALQGVKTWLEKRSSVPIPDAGISLHG